MRSLERARPHVLQKLLQNCKIAFANCKILQFDRVFPACDLPSLFRFFTWPDSAVALQKLCIFAKRPWDWPINFARIFWVWLMRWCCKNCKILQKDRGTGHVKNLKTDRFLQSISVRQSRQKDLIAKMQKFLQKGGSV